MDTSARISDYLEHAIEACDRIQQYTRGQALAQFLGNQLVQDAVLRNFEVLGEAVVQTRDKDPGSRRDWDTEPVWVRKL